MDSKRRMGFKPPVFNQDTGKIFLVYFLLFAGGLWHLLGVLEVTMRKGAPVAMALLSAWLIYEYFRSLNQQNSAPGRFIVLGIWMIIVFTGSIFVEYLGVETGIIFGSYSYGLTLKPAIGSVPLVIGFAWLNMILSSIALSSKFLDKTGHIPLLVRALVIACFMVFFDIIMEPAAVKLGYWSWAGGDIPLQNYLAWFALSYIFMMIAYGMNLFKSTIPVISRHAYFAQLIYFILVNLKA